jgi:hypothetical protein
MITRLIQGSFFTIILYAINTGQRLETAHGLRNSTMSICNPYQSEQALRGVYRAEKQKPPPSLGRVSFRFGLFRQVVSEFWS